MQQRGQTTDRCEVDVVPFTGLVSSGVIGMGRFLLHSLIREVRSPMAAGLHIVQRMSRSRTMAGQVPTTLHTTAFLGGFQAFNCLDSAYVTPFGVSSERRRALEHRRPRASQDRRTADARVKRRPLGPLKANRPGPQTVRFVSGREGSEICPSRAVWTGP